MTCVKRCVMKFVSIPTKLVWTPRMTQTPFVIRSSLEHQEKEKRMYITYHKKRNMHRMLEKRIKFVLHKLNTEYDEIVTYEKRALFDEMANTSVLIRNIENDMNQIEQRQNDGFAPTNASENNIEI